MRYLTERNRRGDRIYFESPSDPDNAITAFANRGGGLTVAICDMQAMDSYNQMFELEFALTRDQALELRDYLSRHFGVSVDSTTQGEKHE